MAAPISSQAWGQLLLSQRARAAAFLRAFVAEQQTLAQRLVAKREFADAARVLASAYQCAPESVQLVEIARAARQAELDGEAQVLYERVRRSLASQISLDEVEEELKALRIKLPNESDEEVRAAQSVRYHLDTAKRHYEARRFALAAQQYALVYALRPLPRVLFNTAQAYRRASMQEHAILLYLRFLTEDPDSSYRDETLGYLRDLRRQVFSPPLYRRPWFWGAVGMGTAVLAAALTGMLVGLQPKPPMTDGGTQIVHFFSLARGPGE